MQVSRDLPKQNVARLEFEGRYLQFGMWGWVVGRLVGDWDEWKDGYYILVAGLGGGWLVVRGMMNEFLNEQCDIQI